jgi:PEP-CTERM motif-containing protein
MMKHLLKLSALGALALPFAAARADLVFDGIVTVGGTGLGTVTTVLTFQNDPTEQGCVGFTSGGDVTGNFTTFNQSGCTAGTNTDVKTGASQTLTRTLSESGITSGSNFAILFNAAEPSGNSISLDGLVANFYNATTGALLFSAVYTGTNPLNFPSTQTGTGNTGAEFTLNAAEAAELQGWITTLGTSGIRVGLGASAGNPDAAQGGVETFFIFNSGNATAVPEPSTVVLTASGMIGLVGFVRRRRRT